MKTGSQRFAAVALALLLAACGGGDGRGRVDTGPLSCSLDDQKDWLRGYMKTGAFEPPWYFWYASSPNPEPSGYASIESYFDALTYAGGDPQFPDADRWSYTQTTESFNRFYGEGKTLGYGLYVAGVEVQDQPDLPLYVRYVEPLSPAARLGLQRGDRILELNDRVVTNSDADFELLSPLADGEVLKVKYRRGGVDTVVSLSAEVFALKPVDLWRVVDTPGGRRLGYVVVKDMIDQALLFTDAAGTHQPLREAFAAFKQAGVQDVVVDLRYNGGGFVSVADEVASFVGGARTAGRTFAQLLYNDRHSDQNQAFAFSAPPEGLDTSRVFVLTGSRTCSASEQVINGLRPFVDVVAIGDTTCGKPFGFLPRDGQCGTTYSAVNFESVNASNEGRYVLGFDATCRVAEDFTQPLGSSSDPLLATAVSYADSNACPAGTARHEQPLRVRRAGARTTEPGERQDLIGR